MNQSAGPKIWHICATKCYECAMTFRNVLTENQTSPGIPEMAVSTWGLWTEFPDTTSRWLTFPKTISEVCQISCICCLSIFCPGDCGHHHLLCLHRFTTLLFSVALFSQSLLSSSFCLFLGPQNFPSRLLQTTKRLKMTQLPLSLTYQCLM